MAAKPVVEFTVVHGSQEVKFRANSDTRISKVWDSYVKSRKWLPSDRAKYRLFHNESESVRLSDTVQGNQISDGARLQVYELSEEEKCTATFCDQNGMQHTFDAYTEDDLQYWVDAFRTWAWGAQGMPPSMQLMEQYVVYDCSSRKKVDLKKAPRLDMYVSEDEQEEGSDIIKATFLCYRYMPPARPNPLTISFWTWDGDNITINVDMEAPLQEAVNACTVVLFGPTVASAALVAPELVLLLKNGAELDITRMRAGSLCNPALGGLGYGDGDEDDTSPSEEGGAAGVERQATTHKVVRADVDYMAELSAGGSLQVAALKGRAAGHPALQMLRPEAFSDQAAGPLYLAASRGHVDSVAALLAWGADPAAENCGGSESAEFTAALHGHEAVVRLMLRHGPGMVARGHTAAAMGKRLQQLVREMGGSRGLMLGCYCACQSTCQRRLTLLTDPNPRESSLTAALTTVPLIAAALRGHVGVIRALLEAGYPPDVQDQSGESALSAAASGGHAAVVALLLAAGASPQHRSLDGETPLHAAAMVGSADCLRLLLEAGADPELASDLLLSYDEVAKLSGRKFRNPAELGEWFRRQPRTSRSAMMDHAGILGGCTPLSLAVGSGSREAVSVLLDATGCNGKTPMTKGKADLLQNLLSAASNRGSSAMVALLLERLQASGAADMTPEVDAHSAASRRAAAGAGSRTRRALRAAARSAAEAAARTGRRGSGDGDLDEEGEGERGEGDGLFDAPSSLIKPAGRPGQARRAQAAAAPPPLLPTPGPLIGGGGAGASASAAVGTSETTLSERAARKARARAARAAQAAEAAAQQEHKRLELKRQQQQERRQQQLLAKKQMQKDLQKQQQQHFGEAHLAVNAGAELREYIQQERQQLRKKLGLDQDAEDGVAPGAAQPSVQEQNASASADSSTDFVCRCSLQDDAMDPRVAAAAASVGNATTEQVGKDGVGDGVGGSDGVRCRVDPENAAVGPRQRRLVVRCSGGCELDYHYPDCWRQLEALLKAARSDYHGLKGPAGRSHAAGIPCWSADCKGHVMSACVMEGPSENPRFRQQLYTSPNATQLQQHSKGGKGASVQVGAAAGDSSVAAAPADDPSAGCGGASRKGDRQKQWQQQSWYGEYEEYDDMDAGGDELQENDQDGEEEEAGADGDRGPRAAEVVDLSTVTLVPLNRRQALAGLDLELDAPAAGHTAPSGNGTGDAGTAAAPPSAMASVDDVDAAPLVGGGGGGAKARGKRGGVKLVLTGMFGREAESVQVEDDRQGEPEEANHYHQHQDQHQQRPTAGGPWRGTSSLPFAVRPVWEGNDGSSADAARGQAAGHVQQGQQARWGTSQQNAGQSVGGGGGGAGSGSGGKATPVRPLMTEEEFPSLLPVNGTAEAEKAEKAARDPIMKALQLLKVPGTDILTRHLLLEGPCLRHLYTILFRGRPRIADAQLTAVLDRYGAMTAFQSFEDGAAVAVSFRSEDVASAVAAGLGAGDALGLLGPGSVAGAGGLEVSCLLEFPTDDALAREMLQAERAAGGFGGRGAGDYGVAGTRLKADAAPFVPRGGGLKADAKPFVPGAKLAAAAAPAALPLPPAMQPQSQTPPPPAAAARAGRAEPADGESWTAADVTRSAAMAAAAAAQRMLASTGAARASTPLPVPTSQSHMQQWDSWSAAETGTAAPPATSAAADALNRTHSGRDGGADAYSSEWQAWQYEDSSAPPAAAEPDVPWPADAWSESKHLPPAAAAAMRDDPLPRAAAASRPASASPVTVEPPGRPGSGAPKGAARAGLVPAALMPVLAASAATGPRPEVEATAPAIASVPTQTAATTVCSAPPAGATAPAPAPAPARLATPTSILLDRVRAYSQAVGAQRLVQVVSPQPQGVTQSQPLSLLERVPQPVPVLAEEKRGSGGVTPSSALPTSPEPALIAPPTSPQAPAPATPTQAAAPLPVLVMSASSVAPPPRSAQSAAARANHATLMTMPWLAARPVAHSATQVAQSAAAIAEPAAAPQAGGTAEPRGGGEMVARSVGPLPSAVAATAGSASGTAARSPPGAAAAITVSEPIIGAAAVVEARAGAPELVGAAAGKPRDEEGEADVLADLLDLCLG